MLRLSKMIKLIISVVYLKTEHLYKIIDHLVIAEELKGNIIDLEGHDLIAVELGHTDTDYTTCLNVPSVGLVIAGMLSTTMFTSTCRVKCEESPGVDRST
jgi:hypothetical protein